jgi:hypothetical protein
MPTRFNNRSQSKFFIPGIQSGYEGDSSPTDLTIPSVGIEDVDIALFNLFDKELPLQVNSAGINGKEIRKVPIIFAASEKWALNKKFKSLRDKNGSLILPLITIVRTGIQQSDDTDITGRGINQQTGEFVIRRKLDASDRRYQNLVNKLSIKHQLNVAITSSLGDENQLGTSRVTGQLTDDPTVQDGGFLASNNLNNIYETLTIPTPQFYTATYDVIIWAQYTSQMNELLEFIISSFLPQGNAWRLDTPKGYWFVATVDGNNYTPEGNSDDMSNDERVIKYKFTIKVPAYILATNVPGAPIPLKRYVSAPSVSFNIGTMSTEDLDKNSVDDPFLGSDDPTLPSSVQKNRSRDQRESGRTRLYPNPDSVSPQDLALTNKQRGRPLDKYKKITGIDKNGKTVEKYVRIITTNIYTGETVYSRDEALGGMIITITDD